MCEGLLDGAGVVWREMGRRIKEWKLGDVEGDSEAEMVGCEWGNVI